MADTNAFICDACGQVKPKSQMAIVGWKNRLPLAPWHEHQVCRLCLNKFNKLFKEERSEQDKDTDRLHTCR